MNFCSVDKIIVVEFLLDYSNVCALAQVYSNFIRKAEDLIFVDFSLSKNLILANISCYMVEWRHYWHEIS